MINKLSHSAWIILDALADGAEPFEYMDREVQEVDSSLTPNDTLDRIFELYQRGFVSISQKPLPGLQSFANREIKPDKPEDITGDLKESFTEYCRVREFLSYKDITGGDAKISVPFGVYIEMTLPGRKEWENLEYECYWKS